MKIETTVDYNSIVVYFDEVIHLILPIRGFRGLQSYSQGNKFTIEFYYKKKTRIVNYDTKEKWVEILKQFNEIHKQNSLF